MALFLGVHKIPVDFSEQEVAAGFGNYKKSAHEMGLHPLSAVYSMEKGFAYCQTEAKSADEVMAAHEHAKIPLEDVIEVKSLK